MIFFLIVNDSKTNKKDGKKMELNKEMFIKLLDINFNASYAEVSRQLGISSAQIFRII